MTQPDGKSTSRTRARYQRIAPFYDLMEILPERRYSPWRRRLWSLVKGKEILEVGVGTGKNMPYYPHGLIIRAVDLTPGMLARARRKAERLNMNIELDLGDAQDLDFPDDSFDAAVASFVFCSVPEAVPGLAELRRVVRPGGQVLLLEHMRAKNEALGLLMDLLNPILVRMTGANINRRTVENVGLAGLHIEQVDDLGFNGIFKLIRARA